MRILAATDGSPYGDAALDQIASRPWPAGSELRLVTVVNPTPVIGTEFWALPPEYFDQVANAVREDGARALAAAHERVSACSSALAVTSDVLEGHPASMIVDEAKRWGADLVVVGSHGYGAVRRLLLGSVSHTVALHAPCSVEIVRMRKP